MCSSSFEALQVDGGRGVVRLPSQGPSSQLDLENIRGACLSCFSPKSSSSLCCRVSVYHTHTYRVNTHGVPVCLCDCMHGLAYACL